MVPQAREVLSGLRSIARRGYLDVVSSPLMERARSSSAPPHARHGYFHSMPDDATGRFDELLVALSRRYRFVAYSEACAGDRSGTMAWSVDDGFGSARTAARVLAEHGISACFFVSPALLDFGPEDSIVGYFRGAHGVEDEVLGWDDAELLLSLGHEIGSHTVGHPDLSALSGDRLDDEIEGSKVALERRLGRVDHFAWPYGRFSHFSAEAYEAAVRAGYLSVASAERPGGDSFGDWRDACIRRDHLDPAWPTRHSLYFATR